MHLKVIHLKFLAHILGVKELNIFIYKLCPNTSQWSKGTEIVYLNFISKGFS